MLQSDLITLEMGTMFTFTLQSFSTAFLYFPWLPTIILEMESLIVLVQTNMTLE